MGLQDSKGVAYDYLTGLDYYKNALKILPGNPQLLYNYATANERIGNYMTAIKFYKFSLEIHPWQCSTLYALAICHFKIC